VIQLYSDDYTWSYWANHANTAISERARSFTTRSGAARVGMTAGRTLSGCACGATRKYTGDPSVQFGTRALMPYGAQADVQPGPLAGTAAHKLPRP
jgi:hypothetical protein